MLQKNSEGRVLSRTVSAFISLFSFKDPSCPKASCSPPARVRAPSGAAYGSFQPALGFASVDALKMGWLSIDISDEWKGEGEGERAEWERSAIAARMKTAAAAAAAGRESMRWALDSMVGDGVLLERSRVQRRQQVAGEEEEEEEEEEEQQQQQLMS